MREVGSAAMPIIPTFDGIRTDLERGLNGPMRDAGTRGGHQFGDNAGKSLTQSLSKHTKRAALLASGALAAGAIGAFKYGSDALDLAADLEQSVGAIDTVFGKSAKRMHRWAETAANDVGLTQNAFNELGTLIGSQLKNGGTAIDKIAPKTKKLIGLGADLSSMFGGTTAEAVGALSSALKGERDPIERYGVSLSQAKIDAEAAALGFDKVDGSLSNQAQQAATLSLIMKQTADAHGNFAKEVDTLSGKNQRLKASLEDTKTEIGTALLPIVADAADFLLKEGVPAFETFADWLTGDGIPAIQNFAEETKPLAKELLPAIGDAMGTVRDALSTAAPYAKDLVGAFNDMPDWITDTAVLAALGLAAGSKLKPGKAGAAGGLLGAGKGSSLNNPMYVWVVNGGGTSNTPPGTPKGGPGLPGLIATAAVVATAAPTQFDSTKSLFNSLDTSGLEELKKTLETDLGDYQDDLGIDLDKLATELYTLGSNSEYVQTVLEKLEKAARPGFLQDLVDGINPFSNKVADIGTGLDHINEALGTLDARAAERKELAGLLGGTPDGAGKAIDLTETASKIPAAKLKVLFDPETEKTRKGVRELLGNVDGLTRNDFKLIFSALGLKKARDDAEALLGFMRDLTGMNIPSGYGPGFIGPVPPGTPRRTASNPSGGGLSVGRIDVYTNDSDKFVQDLTDRKRRASIGGY